MGVKVATGREAQVREILGAFELDPGSSVSGVAYGSAFAANPAGVEIDPESLLAQYRSGVPEQQLLAMPEGPASPIPREHGMS